MEYCITRIFEGGGKEMEDHTDKRFNGSRTRGQKTRMTPKRRTRRAGREEQKRRPKGRVTRSTSARRSDAKKTHHKTARFNRRGPHSQGGYRGLRQLGALRAEGGAAPCNQQGR